MWRLAPLLLLVACEPDINPGTYYCGPEEDCPPDLACDGPSDTCVLPSTAMPFVCPADSNLDEPDDTPATARDLGITGCGAQAFSETGCLDDASDVDHVTFTTAAGCTSIDLRLRAPVAWALPTIELLDDTGAVVATGTVTDELDETGLVHLELMATVTAQTTYTARTRLADGTPDCGGACAYTWYQLSVL